MDNPSTFSQFTDAVFSMLDRQPVLTTALTFIWVVAGAAAILTLVSRMRGGGDYDA